MFNPPLSLNAWLRYDATVRLLRIARDVRSVLEIGAGRGAFGARLAQRFDYVGVEPDRASFEVARRRIEPVGRILNCAVEDLSLKPFDLICALEVLEHLDDDVAALSLWRHNLRPGGWILVSVPSGEDRFGPSDSRVGHHRRYEPDDLRTRLNRAGFTVVAVEHIGFPLGYALHAVWNLAAKRSGGGERSRAERTAESGRWFQPPDPSGALTWAIAAPFRLIQRPFAPSGPGTGLVALGCRADKAPVDD